MKLLDTNVFIYALGRPHPYKDPCAAVLTDASARANEYSIDVELVQELLDVFCRRGERAFAARLATEVFASFPDPLPITRVEVERAAGILGSHRRLSPRDAIHVAVVEVNGLEGIVSTDKAFDRPGLTSRFDPRALFPR